MVETNLTAQALWHVATARSELRAENLAAPGAGQALVRMLYSGISRGTERLVSHGHVPPGEYETMRCPFQGGDFPYPVKYGYCAVGKVEAGPDEWLGRSVFVLHPHQSRFVVPVAALTALPPTLPPRRAILAANMETALNAVWDSGVGPGDKVAVVGAGVVGLLVAYLCASIPGTEVYLADIMQERAGIAHLFATKFVNAAAAGNAMADSDVVFNCSASSAGLTLALASAAFEATIVEMSWYGAQAVSVPLGGAFHSRRLKLVASQVGQIAQNRRGRWTYARRMGKALQLLDDARLDSLITAEVAFGDLPKVLPDLLAPGAFGLTTLVTYPLA